MIKSFLLKTSGIALTIIVTSYVTSKIYLPRQMNKQVDSKLIDTNFFPTGRPAIAYSEETMDFLALHAEDKEKVYHTMVEEGATAVQVAKGYLNLGKLYLQKSDEISHFKAIDYLSSALDLCHSDEAANLIHQSLKGSLDLKVIGDSRQEVTALKAILENDSQRASHALAALRLSAIYKLGRASSKEKKAPPSIQEALPLRQKALAALKVEKTVPIDIVMIFDDKYAAHGATTIASILMNAHPETYYRFHFIMDPENPIHSGTQKELESLSKIKDCSFSFVNFPMELIPNVFLEQQKASFKIWPKLILFRLFLDKLFPQRDRLLYLDGDTVVRTDLQSLYNKQLDGYLLAGAQDIEGFHAKHKTICSENYQQQVRTLVYVNSGVVLFNLLEWRKNNVEKTINEVIHNSKCRFLYTDQDMLNYIAWDRISLLSNRWNQPSINPLPNRLIHHFITSIEHGTKDNKTIKITKPWEFKEAQEFWHQSPEKLPELVWEYWSYRDITPWKI